MIPACALLAGSAPQNVVLSDTTVNAVGPGTGASQATARYGVEADGTTRNASSWTGGGPGVPGTTIQTWKPSGQASSSYQVQATFVSGDALTSGTTGSWLACSSDNYWAVQAASGHIKQTVLSVSIRDAASPNTVRATATITLIADDT